MHILWKLKKAFVKSDGGNNRRPAALQHFVDHRAARRRIRYITPTEKTHQYYPIIAIGTTEKGL
jgi:hypothetical protein